MSDIETVELDNGKYTLVMDTLKGVYCSRGDDKYWRDCVGDNLILFLGMRILELEKELEDSQVLNTHYEELLGVR